MGKNILTTIRLTKHEAGEITRYLRQNPSFASISSLGRVAIMEFIRTKRQLPLTPLAEGGASLRPSFLWDYDVSEAQVREILRHAPFDQRKWLIGRILERLQPPEVFRYLSMDEIRDALPRLRMDPKTARHWQEAVELWTTPAATIS